jgi:hypothetical protein
LGVVYRAENADGALYLVTDCANISGSCVIGRDRNYSAEPETLSYRFPSGGTYYLILDTSDPNSPTNWSASCYFQCATLAVDPREPATSLALREISPNPSTGRTSIFYQLPARGRVMLRIHDLQGRVLRTLVDADLGAGQHQVVWDGTDDRGRPVGAGSYFARLQSGARATVRRMIFLR